MCKETQDCIEILKLFGLLWLGQLILFIFFCIMNWLDKKIEEIERERDK